MKYIKTYEYVTGNQLDYDEGDIVVCVNDRAEGRTEKLIQLALGKKYKVLKIYTQLEDKFMNKPFSRVNVQDLETENISKGWESTRFKLEIEADMDKYNL